MNKNKLILWFGDSHVETISVRCHFIIRLLSYCEIDFDVQWVKLPEQAKKLDIEAKTIPILDMGGKKLTCPEIIEYCRKHINKVEKDLIFPDYSLVQTITFQWATTTLLGLYVNYVYTCEETRKRFFKDFKSTHSEIKDSDLNQISQLMSQWVDHCSSINIPRVEYDNHVFKLIEHFDNQLKDHEFFFGDTVSTTDIAIFSFIFLMCNPHIHKFKEKVRQSNNLFKWCKRMDHLTQHEFRKYRI